MLKALPVVFLLAFPLAAADFPTWMTGSWAATVDGVAMEEHWTGAEGNVMLGMHRDVRPGGKVAFEFIRIEVRDRSLAYVAQPGGRPATVFPIKELTGNRVVFENLQHDFPQRVIYWREKDTLCARVEAAAGTPPAEQWCWRSQTR